jgi:hypothetical protein
MDRLKFFSICDRNILSQKNFRKRSMEQNHISRNNKYSSRTYFAKFLCFLFVSRIVFTLYVRDQRRFLVKAGFLSMQVTLQYKFL